MHTVERTDQARTEPARIVPAVRPSTPSEIHAERRCAFLGVGRASVATASPVATPSSVRA